jgi:flagellar biogenesis protein FliO
MPAIVLGVLSLGVGFQPEALAQNTSQPAARIPYKQDNSGSGPGGGLLLRVAGGLLLMTALAFTAAVLAKRYLPGVRGYTSDGKSRIQLLESRRVTAKLTLFVIEYEGRRLLLAQSGDRVVEIGAQSE